jgi:hypothetical protein
MLGVRWCVQHFKCALPNELEKSYDRRERSRRISSITTPETIERWKPALAVSDSFAPFASTGYRTNVKTDSGSARCYREAAREHREDSENSTNAIIVRKTGGER